MSDLLKQKTYQSVQMSLQSDDFPQGGKEEPDEALTSSGEGI
jgi:hypothetical protein